MMFFTLSSHLQKSLKNKHPAAVYHQQSHWQHRGHDGCSI